MATLETAANPYTTKLGPPQTSERRINFSQSFNGLAWTVGPLIGIFIYNSNPSGNGDKLSSLTMPYFIIGLVVLFVAFMFLLTKLPEIQDEEESEQSGYTPKPLIKERHLVFGVIAQFCYCAAQTGIFSYLINFVTDENQPIHFNVEYGPYFLSIGFLLFMIGRMLGSYLMSYFKPAKMLALYALICCLLLPVISMNIGWLSIIALYVLFFFMSIMFPTIFALSIKDLGPKTKKASSYIIMSIVGGAVFPPLMGLIADVTNSMAIGFLAPIPCFAFILFFALSGHKIK